MTAKHIEEIIAKRRIEKHKNKNLLLGVIILAAVALFTSVLIFCIEAEIELAKIDSFSLTDIASILLVFLIIVIFTAGISIKSIFEASLVSDMVEFRKIKLLGATSKQLKEIVCRERRFIFWNYSASGAVIGGIFSLFFPFPKNVTVVVFSFIVSLVVMNIVVSMCTNKLIKRVMKVNVLPDVYNFDVLKKRKISNENKILKSPTFFLSTRYLLSGGKQSLVTLLSLLLSFTLSVVVLSFLASFDVEKLAREEYKYDSSFIVKMSDYGDGGYTNAIIASPFSDMLEREIISIPGVTQIVKYRLLKMNFANDEDIHNLCNGDMDISKSENGNVIPIVINKGAYWYENGNTFYDLGDEIAATIHCGEIDKDVVLLVDGFVDRKYDLNIYYTSDENLNILTDTRCDCIWYICMDEESVVQESVALLKMLIESNGGLQISSFTEYYHQLDKLFRDAQISIYVICVIICLFTLINMFDSLANNLVKRQKDIGIYRALGMTVSQINVLNYIEMGFYVLFSGLGGILIGIPLGYFLCTKVAEALRSSYLVYVFPAKYLIVCLLFLFLIFMIMKKYVNVFVNKVQIVDNIYRVN